MAVTNLTGYTWIANQSLTITNTNLLSFSVTGTYECEGYIQPTYMNVLEYGKVSNIGTLKVQRLTTPYPSYQTLYEDGWTIQDVVKIKFTGGQDIATSTLISWLETNGTLTAPQPVITDLTGYTWVANDNICDESYNDTTTFNINFTSNNTNYTSFKFDDDGECYINYIKYNTSSVAYAGIYYLTWSNQAHRTILITGGTDATNTTLIAWLQANGTLSLPSLVDVTYNNSTIGSFSDSGTKTLSCVNKYMNSNVVVSAIDLSGKVLSITYGENEILNTSTNGTYTLSTANKVASDNINVEVRTPSGYSVDILVQEIYARYKDYLRIYDGQDRTGTLLHESTTSIDGTTLNLTCLSGYISIYTMGTFDTHQISNIVGNITLEYLGGTGEQSILNVRGNGSFKIAINYDD